MYRCITGSDLDLTLSCTQVDPTGFIGGERFRQELDQHMYRFEWTWISKRRDRLEARALWWGSATAPHPTALDCLWVDPSVEHPHEMGAALLNAGHAALRHAGATQVPEYHLNLPVDWREDPVAVPAVSWRMRAAAGAGLTESIERVSFAWSAGTPIPARSRRLRFRAADDHEFLAAFRAVAAGSLDIFTRRAIKAKGSAAQAEEDLDFYLGLPGRRDRWRLAFDHRGSVVGLIIVSRSAYHPSVSYLGVVPEARGQGYVDDLLAEITHLHVRDGATRITGTTDITNFPMAAAFRRGGYATTFVRLVLAAPPP